MRKAGARERKTADGDLAISRTGRTSFLLRASQYLPLDPREAFVFFEDPRNLPSITPPWLNFRMAAGCRGAPVCLGAEFDYTIRWLGITLPWRSRITEYRPGERFTDVQVRGPYRWWVHRHLFEPLGTGALMVDEVRYELPLTALPCQGLIGRQLEGIFLYRRRRIAAWAAKRARRGEKLSPRLRG